MRKQTLKEWANEQLRIIIKEWPKVTIFRTKEDVEVISKRMSPNK